MTSELLRFSLTPPKSFRIVEKRDVNSFYFSSLLPNRQRFLISRQLSSRRSPNFIISKAVEFKPSVKPSVEESSVILDVAGMMCGACVSRVKSVLLSDDRVDSVVVNMLTESAAIRLNRETAQQESSETVAESLARRLTECGFPTKRRTSGMGVGENVRKWKENVEKKEMLLVNSRNRVVIAWTLVALCCGSHASHILHSIGIHIAHGITASY